MKLTPSSVARRRTASAEAGSLGGPQIPSPETRRAPKPRRGTVSSPPNETVPLELARGLAIFSFIFVLQSIRLTRCERATIVPTGEGWDVVYNKRRRNNFSVQNHQKFYCSRLGDEDLVSICRKASIFRHEHEKLFCPTRVC